MKEVKILAKNVYEIWIYEGEGRGKGDEVRC